MPTLLEQYPEKVQQMRDLIVVDEMFTISKSGAIIKKHMITDDEGAWQKYQVLSVIPNMMDVWVDVLGDPVPAPPYNNRFSYFSEDEVLTEEEALRFPDVVEYQQKCKLADAYDTKRRNFLYSEEFEEFFNVVLKYKTVEEWKAEFAAKFATDIAQAKANAKRARYNDTPQDPRRELLPKHITSLNKLRSKISQAQALVGEENEASVKMQIGVWLVAKFGKVDSLLVERIYTRWCFPSSRLARLCELFAKKLVNMGVTSYAEAHHQWTDDDMEICFIQIKVDPPTNREHRTNQMLIDLVRNKMISQVCMLDRNGSRLLVGFPKKDWDKVQADWGIQPI